jgi:hypothetical protein
MKLTKIVITAGLMSLAASANAQLAFTIEAPGVQSTSVSGVLTESFDSLSLGLWAGGSTSVGTFSAGGTVYATDQYGGANGSQFMRPVPAPIMLTMPAPQNYFGVWWSAGDPLNFLEFFDGATSLGVYNVGSIIPFLSPAYYGNPNAPLGRNTAEPYAYLNFTTTGTEHITSVKFSGANFEFDNVSITERKITPPGTVPGVPDGGSTLGLLAAGIAAVAALKRKTRA